MELCVRIAAGNLDQKIALQQRTAGSDAWGQPLQTWSTVATTWANIRLQTGAEAIRGGAATAAVRASIRIRYRTGVTAGMRVLHGATAYDIEAVLVAPDRHSIDLVCVATDAGPG